MDKNGDAFALLGFPHSFDLDEAEVERAYLLRSTEAHPDLTATSDAEPTDRITELNAAKQALQNPEHRANLLLALEGGPSKEQNRTLPDGFLPEMMEIRERIETETEAGGAAAVEKWKTWMETRRSEHVLRVSGCFRELKVNPAARDRLLREIRIELNAWRYIERLAEQLHPGRSKDAGRPELL